MMKIYRSITINIETGKVEAEDSYEYDGPISLCKGGVKTKTVQSPEAREALAAVMPALYRIGLFGGAGLPLYNVPGAPTDTAMGYFGSAVPSPYQSPSLPSTAGLMPSSSNIGKISPEIRQAVGAPYLEAIGQVTEQFGGGMGSARGGLSGAGGEVLSQQMTKMIPQYTQQLWNMVSPGLQQGYQSEMAKWQADLGAQQADWQARAAAGLAGAQTGAQMQQQRWAADVAARQAPFGPITEIAGGTMPSTIGGTTKK